MSERDHAFLPPSAASRWLRCPGSAHLIASLELDESGIAAAEGTILHSFCEDILRDGTDVADYIGETRKHGSYSYTLTEEDAEAIQAGVDIIDTIPGRLYVEKRVKLDRWLPGQFGTLDVGIVSNRAIHIWDWKWGYIPVSPVENEQLRLYAIGFWENIAKKVTNARRFVFHIWQPRAPRGGGVWECDLDDLLEFAAEVKEKGHYAMDPNAPRVPGPVQCQYCDGAIARVCDEYDNYHISLLFDDFEELDELSERGLPPRMPRGKKLTPERRSFIIENWSAIEKWYERIYADALSDALRGEPTPGLKAVDGRLPARKYKDPDDPDLIRELERHLGDDAYVRKLVSPAQAEKLLGKEEYDEIISPRLVRRISSPVLVPERDSRPALPTLADLFDDD